MRRQSRQLRFPLFVVMLSASTFLYAWTSFGYLTPSCLFSIILLRVREQVSLKSAVSFTVSACG